jgi:hypothetical protein
MGYFHYEQKIVRTVELAGAVMEELAKASGPRSEVVAVQCQEFMQAVKVCSLQCGLFFDLVTKLPAANPCSQSVFGKTETVSFEFFVNLIRSSRT